MGSPATAPAVVLLAVAVLGYLLAVALGAAEAAVLRLTRSAASALAASRPGRAAPLARVLADPGATARSASFVRVLLELVAATCTTVALARWVRPWPWGLVAGVGAAVVVALVVAWVAPRSVGRHDPERTLARTVGVLDVVVRAVGWVDRVARTPSRSVDEQDERVLQEMVDRLGETEAIAEEERDMLRSVFRLSGTVTREVMVPRTDIVSVGAGTTLSKALSLFLRSGFSRVPVVGDSNDDLRGILYFKDVVRVLDARGAGGTDRTVDDVMRPPLLVPESKTVDALLRELRGGPSHLAMVVDEYGGIAGLVTVEDALEEIVGELTDEHDTVPPEAEDLGEGRYRVPARMALDELGDLMGVELTDDDVDTVSGLLAKGLGKVPLPGSRTQVAGIELEADRVEGRRRRLSTVVVHAAHGAPPVRSTRDQHDDEGARDTAPRSTGGGAAHETTTTQDEETS